MTFRTRTAAVTFRTRTAAVTFRMHTAAAAVATLLSAACAMAPGAAPRDGTAAAPRDGAAAAASLGYARVIAPFTVLDENGRAYEHPFLGGFDVPRPQFVDIDGDGDLDLFVQERSNEIIFFENTGTPREPRFVWRTDRFQDLAVGEWYRFIDVDRDGRFDLLGEAPYSHIRYWRNTGTRQQPRLTLAADTLKDVEGKPIFADRQNIANAVDIDCDDLLDLFLGRVDGTITRFEEVPHAAGARPEVPVLRFVTDRFEGIEIVAQIGSSRHGANTMYFADHDGDGDLDLYWGDFFEAGVLLIRNQGTCASPNLRTTPEPLRDADGEPILTSGYNAPAIVDLDGDGTLDLFIGVIGGAHNPNRTAADNFLHYARTARGYELRSRRFLSQIDVGSESIVAFGDINGDGLLDMLVGSKIDPVTLRHARLYTFLNEGTAREPRFRMADTLDLSPSYHYAPVLADLNGNGRLDMLLGTWNDDVLLFWNEGTPQRPRWVQDTAATVRLTRGSNTTPALVDIDGDGDLDLFVGEASGTINFYRNTGTRTAPRFELVSDEYGGIDVGRRSHPTFVDIDGDGDFDMIVGRDEGGMVFFRNEGTRTEPRFVEDTSFSLPLPPLASPVFVDLDSDGRLELVLGNISGGVMLYRR